MLLQALLEWLHAEAPGLASDQGCRGDVETVAALTEAHKRFEAELNRRERSVRFVGESALQLMDRSDEDGSAIEAQIASLNDLWGKVNEDCATRAERLQEAETMAEDFAAGCRGALDAFTKAEQKLRSFGRSASDNEDEEASLLALIDEHAAFHPDLEAQRPAVEKMVQLGEAILSQAHPDGEKPIRNWITTLQNQYKEVSNHFSFSLQKK